MAEFRELLAGQGSNLQPPDSKSGVLPVELPAIECSSTFTVALFGKACGRFPGWGRSETTPSWCRPISAGNPATLQRFGVPGWGEGLERLVSGTSWDR